MLQLARILKVMPGPYVSGLEMNQLIISMPYLDQNDQSVKYTQFEAGYFLDHGSGYANADGVVALYSWLNKANPDWQRVSLTDGPIVPGLTGEGIIPIDQLVGLNIDITTKGNYANSWWGTTDFAKFGVIAYMSAGRVLAPHQFVNFVSNSMELTQSVADSFWYSFAPGVVATVQAKQSVAKIAPHISTSPQVNAYSNTSGPVFPLVPNLGPTSSYGPEVLP